MVARPITAVAVFCGANDGVSAKHGAAAEQLGRLLAESHITLVYGGSSVGLMGRIADTALEAGGKVVGVIPAALADLEIAHEGLTALHIVDSMHERKLKMAALSDAFIAMAGGFGTLDESFEVITWTQLGIHHKPFGFLNVDGYYDGLLQFIDAQTKAGFVKAAHHDMLAVEDQPQRLLDALSDVALPMIGKWR